MTPVLQTGKPVDGEVSVAPRRNPLARLSFEPLRTQPIISLADLRNDRRHGAQSERRSSALVDAGADAPLEESAGSLQAIARQTARHSGSIESFLDQFGARTQALATRTIFSCKKAVGPRSPNLSGCTCHYLDHRASTLHGRPSIVLKPERQNVASRCTNWRPMQLNRRLIDASGRGNDRWRRLSSAEVPVSAHLDRARRPARDRPRRRGSAAWSSNRTSRAR